MIPTWIWIIGYAIIGVLLAMVSVYINHKTNDGDIGNTDAVIAIVSICVWPIILVAWALWCIAAVPIYFGRKLYYRKVKSNVS